MSNALDLYQDILVEHNKKPNGFGLLPSKNHAARGHNPLCGDDLNIELMIEDDVIKAARFHGDSCAISTASASILMEHLNGKTRQEALNLLHAFSELLTEDISNMVELDKELKALLAVKQFPARIKCALLPWKTAEAAISANEYTKGDEVKVSTE